MKNYIHIQIFLFINGILLLLPYHLYSQQQKMVGETQQYKEQIISKHKNQICSFIHKFVYLVTADLLGNKLSVAMVKDGESHYSAWVPDSNINVVTATAYLADQNGHCITSKHAAEPWNNTYDQTLLKNVFSTQLGIPKEAITVSGMSVVLQLKCGNKIATGMLVPNTDPAIINERWLLWKDSSQLTVINATDTLIPSVNYVSGVKINTASKMFICGYNQDNNTGAAVLQPVAEPLSAIAVKNNIVQFKDTGKMLPEGAPVFNEQGDFLGIYSAINNKSENPFFSLISIHPIK